MRKRTTGWRLLALLVLGTALAVPPVSAEDVCRETKEQRDARMAWWRDARFGMFIHWSPTLPAGEWNGRAGCRCIGEWIMDRANIPVKDYETLAGQGSIRARFNAAEWVRIAKDAAKYIVITSKHHDGFCLSPRRRPIGTWSTPRLTARCCAAGRRVPRRA